MLADATPEHSLGSLGEARASTAPRRRSLRHVFARSPALSIAVLFLLTVACGGLFAGFLPYDPIAQDVSNSLAPASPEHFLGTDDLGRDIFTRLVYGSRTTLLVGFFAVALALAFGMAFGTLAGYHGGLLESVVMRGTDVMLSFPLILLAIVLVEVLGPGISNLIVAIGVSQIPIFTRLAHALTLSVRSREYILAAIAVGVGDGRILRFHVLPNILAPIVVQATAVIAVAILYASALSFLGLGIQPPTPDWGSMVSDFRRFVFDRPHIPFYPGATIALTVLALNVVGDTLVELSDPTARQP